MIVIATSILISIALVLISRNIVYAIAFLVTTFFLSSVLFINSGLEFLGYVLIVVITMDINNEKLPFSQVRNPEGYTSHMTVLVFLFSVTWPTHVTVVFTDVLSEKFSFIQYP